jgi:ADP-L-glycero-D-manno-heptose 6-epimerase
MTGVPCYIVTGGAGFIGSNLVAALLEGRPRPRVVVVDNFRTGTYRNIVEACDRCGVGPFDGEVIAASVGEVDLTGLLHSRNPAAVFHEAAITDTTLHDEAEMIRENLGGFRALLEWCVSRGVPLVYASSAGTYGTPPQARERVPFPVEAAGRPENVYGFSKWLMELEHRRCVGGEAFFKRHGPHIVGLRYFNVFGPGEGAKGHMASMPYQLCRQMLAGKRPRIFADGEQARDQVYIDDVVSCTISAGGLRGPVLPGVYNVGSGVATTFNQVVAALRSGLGLSEVDRPAEYFEMPADIRRFYQDWTCADVSVTRRMPQWEPRWEPMKAIASYARWLRERGG